MSSNERPASVPAPNEETHMSTTRKCQVNQKTTERPLPNGERSPVQKTPTKRTWAKALLRTMPLFFTIATVLTHDVGGTSPGPI